MSDTAMAGVADGESHLDLAYTLTRLSYDSQIPLELQRGLQLNVLTPQMQFPNEWTTPAIQPSSQETAVMGSGIQKGLWVGMWSPAAAHNPEINQYFTATENRQGSIADMKGEPVAAKYDPKALRVICPVAKEKAKFYRLVQVENEILCHPVNISRDQVFFFRFARDEGDTLNRRKDRTQKWPEIIRDLIKPEEAQQAEDARGEDLTRAISLPWDHSLAFKAPMMLATFLRTGDTVYLDEIIEDCDRNIGDLGKFDKTAAPFIEKLFEKSMEFESKDAELAFQEIAEHWPEMKTIVLGNHGPESLSVLAKCIRDEKVMVTPKYRRAFICWGLRDLLAIRSVVETDPSVLTRFAKLQFERAKATVGTSDPPRPLPNVAEHTTLVFLQSVKEFVDDILEKGKAFDKQRLDDMAPESTARSLDEIKEAISNSPDKDAIKLYLETARRHDLRDTLLRNEEIYKRLRKVSDTIGYYLGGV